jgi:hypothetical protein
MLESFIKFGFSAGVLNPKLHGRGDLQNYDLGLAEARNWCIDYLGGAFTRPGTEFRDYAEASGNIRLIPFQFNNDIANTNMIVLSGTNIRFMQDGNYVLEASKNIASTSGANITITAHGYTTGQWVKVQGNTYTIGAAGTNTFQLFTMTGVQVTNPAAFGVGPVARVYTLASPYASADLPLLKYSQDGDVIYLNHPTYAERKLTRLGAANWTLAQTSFVGYSGTVGFALVTPSTAGAAGALFAVSVVNSDGEEGLLGSASYELSTAMVDYTTTTGHATLVWPSVAEADYYRIYRSLVIPNGVNADLGMELGFLGESESTLFVDRNIVPDFTITPLIYDNPFVAGGIESIQITAQGSGYSPGSTVSVSGGGGSGFSGRLIINAGVITGVKILNPGSGYVSPTVTITPGGSGSGATATAIATPTSGTFPACSAKVQQRRVRGGTNNNPLGLFASRIGRPDSYATSANARPDDPYILTIDAETQTPIRHLVSSTEGFFAFCDDGVFLIRGVDDSAISATTAKASTQTSEGASHVRPIRIDREVLYLGNEFDSIHAIGPSNLPTYFTTTERTTLASHYFSSDNPVVSMAWAKAPHKLLWAARRDGTFLSCCYNPAQETFAWSDHSTAGQVLEIAAVRENSVDRLYLVVSRNGFRFIERLSVEPDTEEDMWSVDAGVRSTLTTPAATVTVSGLTGTITVTASSGIFSAADLGKSFRAGGGRGRVIAYTVPAIITVQLDIPIRQAVPELTTRSFAQGSWSLTADSTTFSGLQHLEGRTVEVLADGAEIPPLVVTNGSITLPEPASYVVAGLGFTGKLKTLPPSISGTVLEDREKNVKGIAVRLFKARGLRFGDGEGDITYPLPARTTESLGVAPRFKTGIYDISIRAGYDFDGAITVLKQGPQSASILGLVTKTDVEG